jgi:hypothetical protein
MNTKKILSWIALLLGEAIIIAAFLLFRGNMSDNILVLNIIVTNIIYGLFFIDILVPFVDFDDKSQKEIGSLGVRWFFTGLYVIAAIVVMILANVAYVWILSLQIIIHGVLFFMLLLGFIVAFHSSEKVEEVYGKETVNRSGINEMKIAMRNLKDKMNGSPDLPVYFITQINILEENIRFISPTNTQEGQELERMFAKTANEIAYAVSNFSMNEEAIKINIKKLEITIHNRKQVYSH